MAREQRVDRGVKARMTTACPFVSRVEMFLMVHECNASEYESGMGRLDKKEYTAQYVNINWYVQ